MIAIPVVLGTLGLAWILTKKKRILPLNKESIINRIHPGELDKLKEFMPRNCFVDVLKTDAYFYDRIGGFQGLRREHENAVCCVQLCQVYVRDSNMDKDDVDYVARRAFVIGFLVKASVPLQAIRLFRRRLPHLCARWIVCLYWEAATYTQMIHREYDTGKLAL